MDLGEVVAPDGSHVAEDEAEIIRAAYESSGMSVPFPQFVTSWFTQTCSTPVCSGSGPENNVSASDLDASSVNATVMTSGSPSGISMSTGGDPPAGVSMDDGDDLANIPVIGSHTHNSTCGKDEADSSSSSDSDSGAEEVDPNDIITLAVEMSSAAASLDKSMHSSGEDSCDIPVIGGASAAVNARASASARRVWVPEDPASVPVLERLPVDPDDDPVSPGTHVVPNALVDTLVDGFRGRSLGALYDGSEDFTPQHTSSFLDTLLSEDDASAAAAAAAAAVPTTLGALPTVFITKMDRAWGTFVGKGIQPVPKPYAAQPVAERASVDFTPIANTITLIGKGSGVGDLTANYQALGAMASVIMRASIVGFKDRANARPYNIWIRRQIEEIAQRGAASTGVASSLIGSDSLLTERTIQGKVTKGLTIIMNKARAQTSAETLRKTANDGTYAFMNPFVERWDVSVVGGKTFDRDTSGLFYSAMCGVVLMRTLYNMADSFTELRSIRDDYLSGINAVTLQIIPNTE